MNKQFVIFGRAVPLWLIVGGLLMAASGAGVGTVLAGSVTGEMPVTVSQALLVGVPFFPDEDPDWTDGLGTVRGVIRQTMTWHHAKPDRFIGVRNDEKTGFQAAAEIDQGDEYVVGVCFKNASHNDIVAQLDMQVPDGVEVELFGGDEDSHEAVGNRHINNVTRIGANSWKLIVRVGAEYVGTTDASDPSYVVGREWRDCVGIQVKADDTNPPGFYSVKAKAKQIAY